MTNEQLDINASNASMRDDGRAILLDWEEATVGCPLFSLDRLLDEAHELSAVETVTDVYLDTLRAGGSEPVECAMHVVPLKLAHESRACARALGLATPTHSPDHTTAGAGSEAINGRLPEYLAFRSPCTVGTIANGTLPYRTYSP